MFLTTRDQERVLSVLEKTGCLRIDQAARLLNDIGGKYAERVLRQLRYMQKIYRKTDTAVTLPHRAERPLDTDMLAAVDIMLDIAGGNLLAVSSGKPPFKLCFLTETGEGVGSYAVLIVPKGAEAQINFHMDEAVSQPRTLILMLEDIAQRERLTIPLPHFFAVFDGGYRYFEGE